MTVTFVTAFLDLYEDRSKDKSAERCFHHFKDLMATGISIHLFLSRSYKSLYEEICGAAPNVHVDSIELTDLTTYKELADVSYTMPSIRTAYHDTQNFMILMNSKVEFLHRAMKKDTSSHYAWIDFSIFHIFRDKVGTTNYLQMLARSSLAETCLIIPGCWPKLGSPDFSCVNWRFCGGFFLGDRDSLENYYSVYRRLFRQSVVDHGLTWEVNMWAWLEHKEEIHPTWIKADHNDSIVRIPGSAFKVVASLTTIPPRIETECRRAIDSLLSQVDHIYLSVAKHYKRFGTWKTPDYFFLEPYYSRMTVVYTEDLGPATKYLGALSLIPNDSWIFICDDDQEYHPSLVKRMKDSIQELAVYQNHYENIRQKTSGGMIHGYVGLLAHRSLFDILSQFPLPPCAYFVDDQWMSIYCFRRNIPVVKTGVEDYSQIYRVLDDWHEKIGTSSLAGLHNRAENVRAIEKVFGVKFHGGDVQNSMEELPGRNPPIGS